MTKKWDKQLDRIRSQNRKDIIIAAEEIFLKNGLSGATMKDIAKKAGISRPTLYKYFNSIDELVFEIQIKIINEMNEYMIISLEMTDSHLDNIKNSFLKSIEYAKKNPEHIRFIGIFDNYYSIKYPNKELEERYRENINKWDKLEDEIIKGKKNGRIREDIDVHKTALLLLNSFLGMLLRMFTRRSIISKEQNIDPEEQLREHVEMLMAYISKE